MQKIFFTQEIKAPKEKVWDVLFGKETYPKWTTAFSEESHVETDWKEGSKALFGDGKGNGMVSVIERNVPNEYMSIKHIGTITNGVEDTESESVKLWAGALENYSLSETKGVTTLKVDMDTNDEYKDFFEKTWPLAMDKIKALAEKA